MRTFSLLFLLSSLLFPIRANADEIKCSIQKYNQYIESSLFWYQSLTQLAVQQNSDLKDVAQWFLKGRRHHLALNQQALSWYFQSDQSKIKLNGPVESWIRLTQADIKDLTRHANQLLPYAQRVFHDRQQKPHPQNYQLRTMFASLLTQPQLIRQPLIQYNSNINNINKITCS